MKKKKEKEKQLDFGLRNTPKNVYYKYKDQYELWLAGLETKKFIKDPFTWFSIIISLTFIITEIFTIETSGAIPSKIPILNYYTNPIKRLSSNEYIYLFPLLGIVTLLGSIVLSNRFYHKERDLAKVLLLIMLLTNMSFCFMFLKLFLIF